jgi:hypothetical protein
VCSSEFIRARRSVDETPKYAEKVATSYFAEVDIDLVRLCRGDMQKIGVKRFSPRIQMNIKRGEL